MTWLEALILGSLQGVTEFLPISSSGHLVLMEYYLGLEVETLKSFDVLVHVGSLLAILIYFWKDFMGMIKVFFAVLTGKMSWKEPYAILIFYIVIASVPAVILGLVGEDFLDEHFRNLEAVGISMFFVGIIFVIGEFTYLKVHKKASINQKIKEKKEDAMELMKADYVNEEIVGLNWWKAIVIGIAQAVALIPGVSRSGSTIVAGLFQGIERKNAARFSFLMGSPVIFGAGLLTALKIPENGGTNLEWGVMMAGFISSFLVGLFSIWFLMQFLRKHTLLVFSVYLIALGLSVFAF